MAKFVPSLLFVASATSPTHNISSRFFFYCRLLRAASSAMEPGSIEYVETVHEIRKDHLQVAADSIRDADILKRTQEYVNQDCDRLKSFLQAVQVSSQGTDMRHI